MPFPTVHRGGACSLPPRFCLRRRMKTSELLSKRYKGNEDLFQAALRKIKPLSKYPEGEELPIKALEKLIAAYEYKYSVQLDYIHPLFFPDRDRMYSAVVRNTDTKELYPVIHALGIYEILCKVCIFYYSEVTIKKAVGFKDWSARFKE